MVALRAAVSINQEKQESGSKKDDQRFWLLASDDRQ
jgi:hypothetical protein